MADPTNPPGERRLAHPPSDRYRTAATPATGPAPAVAESRGLGYGLLAALVGAVAIAVLGGVATVTAGLVVVAAATGWAVGAVVPRRRRIAVGLAMGGVALGQAGLWAYALSQGGVLGPLDLLWQVYGVLVPLQFLVAGLLAWIAAR